MLPAPSVEASFDIDANGIIHVSAKNKKTNKEQKVEIKSGSGLSEAEIRQMVADAEAHREDDKKSALRVPTRPAAIPGPFFPQGRCMPAMDFELDREYVELNQLLKLTGICDSGGAGKALVASGVVRVDGQVEMRKTRKVQAGSVVTVDEVEIRVVPAA